MKTKKMKPKNNSVSSGLKKRQKRSIDMRGKWKTVELDPSLFSEEGLEGLVCFEELTNYRMVDSEKVVAKTATQQKKEKKKAKKRKVCEADDAEEKGDAESKEGEKTAEPAKKKAKKKKKNKKAAAKESAKSDDSGKDLTENDKKESAKSDDSGKDLTENDKKESAKSDDSGKDLTENDQKPSEDGGQNEVADEVTAKKSSEILVNKTKPSEKRKDKKKKKKSRQLTGESAVTEEQPCLEFSSEKEKSSQNKLTKPPKSKAKNWTYAALSGSDDKKSNVSAWKDLFVPSTVLKALSSLGFSSPTPIQALTLPSAIRDHMDILGAAETGSGKTLAFAIPMIHTILEWKKSPEKTVDDNTEPTPEDTGEPTTEGDKDDDMEASEEEGEDPVYQIQEDSGEDEHDIEDEDQDEQLGCVKVVEDAKFDFKDKHAGGQNKPLLGLVLTPTRELAVQVKHHIDAVAKFTDIKTATVVGGMSSLKQKRVLKHGPEIIIATPGRLWDLIKEGHPHLLNLRQLKCLVIDEADRMVERGHFAELESLLEMLTTTQFNPTRQTFVFSATLTMAHSLPTRVLQKKKLDKRSKLEILMEKVGIKSKPKVVDLTRKESTVETLTETQICCQKDDKDFYLYYFVLQYPGRTMVFANSIDCIKRLNSLLTILGFTTLPLHANMHQKQRLRNLERFAERESCVLLTTDVAARGLDIPNVQHVIHYQIPRTSETYVHRSGRTARATKEGLSLLLMGPDDIMNFKKIYKTLGKEEELPEFPIETKCMEAIKERVKLAREIEKIEFYNSREKQHDSWFKRAAKAMEVDLDDDLLLGAKDEDADREQKKMVKGMRKHMKHLVSQPIFKNVIKTKYPTQLGKLPLSMIPHAGMESALTKVLMQKTKQKLKKNVLIQQKKEKQQ